MARSVAVTTCATGACAGVTLPKPCVVIDSTNQCNSIDAASRATQRTGRTGRTGVALDDCKVKACLSMHVV